MVRFQKKEVTNVSEISEQPQVEQVQETKEVPRDSKSGLPIESAPKEGEYLYLSVDGKEWTPAYWKKTRKLEHFKWVPSGKWFNPFARANIEFVPIYWKQYV